MTTFSYDFTDAGEFGDYVTLTPGRYIFEFVKVERGESKAGNPKAVVTLKVVAGGPEIYVDGLITQHWPVGGGGSGRFKSFMGALGIKSKDRGKVNLAQYYGEEVGAIVELEAGDEPREDGTAFMFHNLKAIHPGSHYRQVLGLDSEADEEEDEPEEDDVEDDEDDDEEEVFVEDSFDGMKLAELKEIAEEYDISTDPDEGKTKLSVAAMKARLIAELVGDEEDEDEDEEDEEDDDGEDEDVWTAEDLDELELAELRELAKDWDVSTKPAKGKKSASAALLRSRLKDALEAEDDDEGEEDPF